MNKYIDLAIYISLADCTGALKTPKYTANNYGGGYAPVDGLKGRDGKFSVYLLESANTGASADAPALRLQAKDSLNLTGLKGLVRVNNGLFIAYGTPPDTATYGKSEKKNPFYGMNDGFIVFLEQEIEESRPSAIHLFVLKGMKGQIAQIFEEVRGIGWPDGAPAEWGKIWGKHPSYNNSVICNKICNADSRIAV